MSGIADPAITTAWFAPRVDPAREHECGLVPDELLDPLTHGTFADGSLAIGRLECEGLPPGSVTLELRAVVRMLHPSQHVNLRCECNRPWRVRLDVEVEGGSTAVLDLRNTDPNDRSCRGGPAIFWSRPVTVGASGRLSVRVDLRACERGGEATNCLFLRGTSLRVRP